MRQDDKAAPLPGEPMAARTTGPLCPFCGAGWTDEMLDQLDRFTSPSSCACCAGAAAEPATPMPHPTEDISCASCGRPIYRAVSVSA